MSHHAIAMFLEAIRTKISADKTSNLQPLPRVEPCNPPIFYWAHLDTMAAGEEPQRKKRQRDVPQYPSVESEASEEEALEASSSDRENAEEETFCVVRGTEEVEVIGDTPLDEGVGESAQEAMTKATIPTSPG